MLPNTTSSIPSRRTRATPLIDSLSITVQDLPNRVVPFLNPALNPIVAVAPDITFEGRLQRNRPIKSITFAPTVAPGPGLVTGTITLTFYDPLPDDRFTLTIQDDVVDPAGNKLDGESNASEPQEAPTFPTGDGIPGGDFVARFTVDSRPEVGTWSSGNVYIDTNGNTSLIPLTSTSPTATLSTRLDTGRRASDGPGIHQRRLLRGQFQCTGGTVADGFDKLAVYGSVGSGHQRPVAVVDRRRQRRCSGSGRGD